MALAHVQTGSLGFVASGPVSSTLSPTAAAALIVQCVTSYNPAGIGPTAGSDDQGNVYVQEDEISIGADPFSAAMFSTINAAAGVTSATITPSDGTFTNTLAIEIGNAAGAVRDMGNALFGTTGGGGAMTIAGVTPSAADNIAVVVFSWYSIDDPSTPSGWTLAGKKTDFVTSQTIAAYYKIQAAATPLIASANINAGIEWCAVMACFSVPPPVAPRPNAFRIAQSPHIRRYP